MDKEALGNLVLQSLEHEKGGVKLYEAALDCASNEDLRKEWQDYLRQTRHHVQVLERLCESLGVDPEAETPGREIVRMNGAALLQAIERARASATPEDAQIVACECVVLAETKDHADWALLGQCARAVDGEAGGALREAYEAVEDQEDEHLYHTRGWCRELWLQKLGLPAVLPPPEEVQRVHTAVGAARAEQASALARVQATARRGG